MSLTLASTTAPQSELNFTVESPDWESKSPPKGDEIPEKLPKPGEFHVSVQSEESKQAEDERYERRLRSKGSGHSRPIDRATKEWKTAEARAIMAETRVRELERLTEASGENPREERAPVEEHASAASEPEAEAQESRAPQETETPPSKPVRPGAPERYDAGVRKYGDVFATAIADADRDGVRIADRAIGAIEFMRNSEDILLYLATHRDECKQLLEESDSATDKVGKISRYLMENPEAITEAITQTQRPQHEPQQPQADPETARQMEKFHSHFKRSEALLAARADAAKLIADAQASGVGISPAVNVALVEQDNGEHVLLHLLEKPELRKELNQLSYPAAMAKVTKIAAQLEAKAEAKQRSRPPAPITPVGTSAARSLSIWDKDFPIAEFVKIENKREWAKRKARG